MKKSLLSRYNYMQDIHSSLKNWRTSSRQNYFSFPWSQLWN